MNYNKMLDVLDQIYVVADEQKTYDLARTMYLATVDDETRFVLNKVIVANQPDATYLKVVLQIKQCYEQIDQHGL